MTGRDPCAEFDHGQMSLPNTYLMRFNETSWHRSSCLHLRVVVM
jgi:hypothetical protein